MFRKINCQLKLHAYLIFVSKQFSHTFHISFLDKFMYINNNICFCGTSCWYTRKRVPRFTPACSCNMDTQSRFSHSESITLPNLNVFYTHPRSPLSSLISRDCLSTICESLANCCLHSINSISCCLASSLCLSSSSF